MKCDKCEKDINPKNDAANILSSITNGVYQSRHLLPVGECPGSPSLAQYLPGHPRDLRPGRPEYNEVMESLVREVYRRMSQW